jgi:L-lactate dehydrogenase
MKFSIVGIGHVGSAAAYALTLSGVVDELVLVSRNRDRANGEALDLQHAAAMLPHVVDVRSGDLDAIAGSELTILTMSAPTERPGRHLLAPANGQLFREMIPWISRANPDGILLVVSNPVDALTWLTIRESGFEPRRVIGCGTIIDSARFRAGLSRELRVHPDDIRSYVLGEHGEFQFPATSIALAGGAEIGQHELVDRVFREALASPLEVLNGKGHTSYAVAQAIVMIGRSIALNEQRTLPVSSLIDGYLDEHDVCLSLPCVVGRQGIVRQLHPQLDEAERAAWRASAASVRETIRML